MLIFIQKFLIIIPIACLATLMSRNTMKLSVDVSIYIYVLSQRGLITPMEELSVVSRLIQSFSNELSSR